MKSYDFESFDFRDEIFFPFCIDFFAHHVLFKFVLSVGFVLFVESVGKEEFFLLVSLLVDAFADSEVNFFEVFDSEGVVRDSVMDNDEVEVEAAHEVKDLFYSVKVPLSESQLVVLIFCEVDDIRLNIKLFTMIKFFLLPFFNPVINGSNFVIFLDDGFVKVMVNFGDLL
jgi:hypothetical protein